MTAEEYYHLSDEFYLFAEDCMNAILQNIVSIYVISQAILILLCGICIYNLFWGRK